MFLAAIQLEADSLITDENPLEYRFKLSFREARGEASPREDEKFKSWDRVLKR